MTATLSMCCGGCGRSVSVPCPTVADIAEAQAFDAFAGWVVAPISGYAVCSTDCVPAAEARYRERVAAPRRRTVPAPQTQASLL